MPVIKAIFFKHVFHHFIFCLLLLLYRDSMTLLVEKQVDFFQQHATAHELILSA
jgi:hypothetical protein